jgi:fructose-1,6-bisphosphatase/inositol monophosphatase family enzyme
MKDQGDFGPMTDHAVGRILKEAVRRAMVEIRTQRANFKPTAKGGYDGSEDVFTSADIAAQEIYLRTFRECFPLCGVVAEEHSLKIECPTARTLYFTVDPLDGTKAYVRRQSHGVGTMVALVDDDAVISAYIGDVNTNEVYGYRPGSPYVHRITDLDHAEDLFYPTPVNLGDSYVLLRDPVHLHSPFVERTVARFKNHEVMGSSIGTWMARLWKREVSAAILPPGVETPWDSTPVIGISRKLGFVFLRPSVEGDRWTPYTPQLSREIYTRHHETLVIHHSQLPL